MAKVSNEAKIEYIAGYLSKGWERKDILREFAKIYDTSSRTFDSLLKQAQDRVTERNRALELERQANVSESLKNEIQAQIITEQEIDLILSKMITGGIEIKTYLGDEVVIREITPSEIINAADKMYKRKGSYAPAKIASTDSEGKDIAPPAIKLPNGATIDLS